MTDIYHYFSPEHVQITLTHPDREHESWGTSIKKESFTDEAAVSAALSLLYERAITDITGISPMQRHIDAAKEIFNV